MKRTSEAYERHVPPGLPGFAVHRNPKNGFVVVEIDYYADPAKRDPEWVNEERRKMPPKQWAVEMERSWETYSGKAVYDKVFYRHLHVLSTPQVTDPNFPIFRGWDFGGSQSCVIGQIIGPRLTILDELPNGGLNTRTFAPEVIAFCNQRYGTDYHYIDVVDPSSFWEGKTAEGKACTDVMRQFGIVPIAAPTNDPQKRTDAVSELMLRLVDGRPCLLLNPHCSMLIKGFEGGYHYPEKPTQARRMDRPVKNLYSHIHDALQYVALRMKQYAGRERTEDLDYEQALTIPRYRFSNRS